MSTNPHLPLDFRFAEHSLVGQPRAKETITRTLLSDRLHHAYLFAGPQGTGKKVAALAMAEAVNGISNLNDLGSYSWSKKSNWLHHPDIHIFIPTPSSVSFSEIQQRIALLADDPYMLVDFGSMPDLNGLEKSKNRRSFYPLAYYEKDIRPVAYLSPNEGKRTIIIITQIETMRKEVTNAFLKLLEEPPDSVMFILTTDQPDALLPTILSRCQLIHFNPVSRDEIELDLVSKRNYDQGNARYLSRISGGNYAMTRFYDQEALNLNRDRIIQFLRASYAVDATKIIAIADSWSKELNNDAIIDLLNMMEIFLRDLMIWSSTASEDQIINIDQLEVIQNFSEKLPKARISEMIAEIAELKQHIIFNVNIRLLLIVLGLRYTRLMRGLHKIISIDQDWKHFPHLIK